jgi:two-component system, NarL family, response regulator
MGWMHEPGQGPAPLRVLVVDADDRVCESLAGLLGIGDRLVVVGGVGRVGPALELVTTAKPDVVVVDPRLPAIDDGLDFLRRLRAQTPDIRVVVLGTFDGPDHDALMAAGDAFVRKTFRPTELVTAIEAAGRRPLETRPRATL